MCLLLYLCEFCMFLKRFRTNAQLCADSGQMMYMEQWNMMLYLATPVMPDLDALLSAGLYINDLSLHDCSR